MDPKLCAWSSSGRQGHPNSRGQLSLADSVSCSCSRLTLSCTDGSQDAALCVEHQVDGIGKPSNIPLSSGHLAHRIFYNFPSVLSNHGGRQLEFSRPPIDVLQEIRRKNPEVLESGMQIFVVSLDEFGCSEYLAIADRVAGLSYRPSSM